MGDGSAYRDVLGGEKEEQGRRGRRHSALHVFWDPTRGHHTCEWGLQKRDVVALEGVSGHGSTRSGLGGGEFSFSCYRPVEDRFGVFDVSAEPAPDAGVLGL